jgi:cytochrome c peroxidase
MTPLLLMLLACGTSDAPPKNDAPPTEAAAKAAPVEEAAAPPKHAAMFGVLAEVPVAPAEQSKVDLGRQLYYDTRLSLGQDISCNSCHLLDKFGADGQPTSPGHKGQRGGRNSPTSINAFAHIAQFWDGRAPDVEAQAKGPVLNPIEMAMPDEDSVVKLLGTIPGYVSAFDAVYPGDSALSYDHMADAIGAFERHLTSPGRFDAYLEGDTSALTDAEQKGLDTFVATGCTACHNGALLGGNSYQKLGAVVPYETSDLGRGEVTGDEADNYFFKVPSLRNIAETGPYFHDGAVATLEDAVHLMAKHQLGRDLSEADNTSIVTFLGALTGEVDKTYVAKPELPENGPSTPGPG